MMKCNIINTFIIVTTMLVVINTVVRLTYPSRYVPAAQEEPGFFTGPVFARIIATFAEVLFYLMLAYCFRVSPLYPFVVIVVLGEALCWAHLFYQSELLGWLEDITWAILFSYTFYFATKNRSLCFFITAPYILYMIFIHLPRMFKRIKSPYFAKWTGSAIVSEMDSDTKLWTRVSLILKPIVLVIIVGFVAFDTSGH